MIKSTLITNLANKFSQIPEKDIAFSINEILEHISNQLMMGKRIEIRGFGSFCLHYRAPRNAHNPKNGSRLKTSEKYSPHFKPGKEMRDRINDSAAICSIKDDIDEE